jgi:hypothetical protein
MKELHLTHIDQSREEHDLLFRERMDLIVRAKELEKEFIENHPDLIEEGMEINIKPANEIYEFEHNYFDELIVDVKPWIHGYIQGFDGNTKVTMGTVMPTFGSLQPAGNASTCWNSGVKGKSLMDASKGEIVCRTCTDATSTGNVADTDNAGGYLNWEFRSGTKKQWIGVMFSHLLNFEYAYEFEPNEPRSHVIFDASIIGGVVESDLDGTNKKTILSNENFLIFNQKFNTDKHSPRKGGSKKNTNNQIKSIEFQMQPNKLYNIYLSVYNYTSSWHAKAALKIGYQHIPFA